MNDITSESPKGYADADNLETVRKGENPVGMVDRLLKKTGLVENTIRGYCQKEGLDPQDPKYILLALSGTLVSVMGRRAQRKHPESSPKEMLEHEWPGALRAHNFVAEVVERIGEVDKAYTQKVDTIRPGWREVRPQVFSKLEELGVSDLSTLEARDLARQQILLEKYRHLERNMKKMTMMVFIACKKYGISGEQAGGLTRAIMDKHYPDMPGYDPESVDKRTPLAYENRTLIFWGELVELLD